MYKIGNSIDIHVLEKGDYILMGGIKIPSKFKSVSFSDGDALSHCVSEAIIGALGKGDLGENFPNDEKNKNRNSIEYLYEAKRMLNKENYKISNIDIMIVIESVKLNDYKSKIAENIATIFDLNINQVNVKAGTNEKIGSIGNDKSYLTWCNVLIYK